MLDNKNEEQFLLTVLSRLIKEAGDDLLPSVSGELAQEINNLSGFMFTRGLLGDDISIKVYEQFLTYLFAIRIFQRGKARTMFMDWKNDYNREKENTSQNPTHKFQLKAQSYFGVGVFTDTYLLNGYSYADICKVLPGDVVFDLGAYRGDTSVYFAGLCGETGRVYAFEPFPENYEILKKAVGDFGCSSNVIPVNAGVGASKTTAYFALNPNNLSNKAAAKERDGGQVECSITTIDSYVAENNISHVNFIKMDIEGAELDALIGAKKTIEDMHPKLAICIYHKTTHHFEIPELILSFNPRYRFFLKQNSLSHNETVLFALPVDYTIDYKLHANYELEHIKSAYRSIISKLAQQNLKLFFHKVLNKMHVKPPLKWVYGDVVFAKIPEMNIEFIVKNGRYTLFLRVELRDYSKYDKKLKKLLLNTFSANKPSLIVNESTSLSVGYDVRIDNDNDGLEEIAARLLDHLIVSVAKVVNDYLFSANSFTCYFLDAKTKGEIDGYNQL